MPRPPPTKVVLVCPSCHTPFERLARYVRAKKSKGQERFFCSRSCRLPEKREHAHGTRTRYFRGCRCTECRGAQQQYMQRYRAA